MNDDILRKVQLVQLEIAKEIKRVCEENDIQYFLDSGTLLGAIRHKGFIPWDDDMDIGMLREDYERFLEIAPKKLGKDYFLQTPNSDKNYGLYFSKVRKIGTLYVERLCEKSKAHNEIWVDVFPYDNFPDGKKARRNIIKEITYCRRILYVKSGIRPWVVKTNVLMKVLCFFGYLPYRLVSIFINRDGLLNRAKKIQTQYNKLDTQFKFSQGAWTCGKWLVPSKALVFFENRVFEDDMFPTPEDYDSYLKSTYGDYMTLPPEEKRGNQHQIIEVRV